jgi:thiamine pyrophosphate-dependent acetolactate synthase large subunit-like protein
MAMPLVEALEALQAVRTDRQIVLPTMGAAREWLKISCHPLDFAYVPSAMGQAPALGLGLALAQPEKQVIVGNGDGCMLMNLGCLVTITAAAPSNYVLLVFDNGVYEVTGQQATPASSAVRPAGCPVDWIAIARGCGFRQAFDFAEVTQWRANISAVLAAEGPTFVVLHVDPVPGGTVPQAPGKPSDRVQAFAAAVCGNAG